MGILLLLGTLFAASTEDLGGAIGAWVGSIFFGVIAAISFILIKEKKGKISSLIITLVLIATTSFVVLRFGLLDLR